MSATVPDRLKRRSDFIAVSKGIRIHQSALTLQAARRSPAGPRSEPVGSASLPLSRVGLTVTKKVGTATERNRIRRRLREALRHAKALSTDAETDYVVVARRDVLSLPFTRLIADLEGALRRAGGKLRNPRGSGPAPRRSDNI